MLRSYEVDNGIEIFDESDGRAEIYKEGSKTIVLIFKREDQNGNEVFTWNLKQSYEIE
jgi:hypothetical protein